MSLKVDDFKAKLTGGGARSNLFKAIVAAPGFSNDMTFMFKAASIPEVSVEPITVPFRGRQIQVAGDKTFSPWTITVINDTNFAPRDAFEAWSARINSHTNNTGSQSMSDYYASGIVQQLDKEGSVMKDYNFVDIWPSNISEIELNFDSENTIEEFTVELQINYWVSRAAQ